MVALATASGFRWWSSDMLLCCVRAFNAIGSRVEWSGVDGGRGMTASVGQGVMYGMRCGQTGREWKLVDWGRAGRLVGSLCYGV